MFLLTAIEVEMKLVDAFQSDDTVLNHVLGKQFSNVEEEPYRCLCPLPVIPLLGIIPMEIQQPQKAICRKILSAVLSIKTPNRKHKWPTL